MKKALFVLGALIMPALLFAAEVTEEALAGKWIFTHMILDGETNRPVNQVMEFLSDGIVVNYTAAGTEQSRASYELQPGVIVYSDTNGKQKWKLKEFDGKALHVNHMGADMFFKKQS